MTRTMILRTLAMLVLLIALLPGCSSGSSQVTVVVSITTPTPLPPGQATVAYNATITASGGSGSGYTWTVIAGALPPNLTLGASGTPSVTLNGTPAAQGNASFTIQVTDDQGATGSKAFTLQIAGPPGSPAITALVEVFGPVGAPLRIVGSAFGATQGSSTVSVGSTPVVDYLTWSDTEVSALVPAGATTGNVTLTTAVGSDQQPFTVTTGTAYYIAGSGSDTSNPGTRSLPFQTVQHGVDQALPGDWVIVRGGTYAEEVLSQRNGGGSDPTRIVISGYPGETARLDRSGRLLRIDHTWHTVMYLECDGNFGNQDGIRTTNADNLILRGLVVHDCGSASTGSGSGDGIDIEGGSNLLVEDCEIFDCLDGSLASQEDSHGIVLGNFTGATIRNCTIYRITGDCIQADPDRDPWSGLVIEGCHLYTEAMPTAKALWNIGEIPGENAFDSKQDLTNPKSDITIRDCVMHGFSSGWIGNMAALNIKDNVSCVVERCIVYDNVIAFRVRGPTSRGGAEPVIIRNCLTYQNDYAIRYEDGINDLQLYHCTIMDSAIGHFQNGGGGGLGTGFVCMNSLFQDAIPSEATHASNQAVLTASLGGEFVNAAARDYHLTAAANALNAGVGGTGTTDDLEKNPRPVGAGFDVGCYERQ